MADILETKIGPAIRSADGKSGALKHVPREIPIHLQLDSAGGHGGAAKIAAYVLMMLTLFNIIIHFQPPNSPDTNALDVGFWCALQAAVSTLCRTARMNSSALVAKVLEAWNSFDCPEGAQKLKNIIGYLRIEAINTVLDNGGNDRAESVRGKKAAQYPANYMPAVVYVADRNVFLAAKNSVVDVEMAAADETPARVAGGDSGMDEESDSEDEGNVDGDNVYIN